VGGSSRKRSRRPRIGLLLKRREGLHVSHERSSGAPIAFYECSKAMQWLDQVKTVTSRFMSHPLNFGMQSLVQLTVEERIKLVLAREDDSTSPDLGSVVWAWSLSNIMFTSAVLDAVHELEKDLQYWDKIADGRRPGIWIRGKEAMAFCDSSPPSSSLRLLHAFISALYMHVGVLKMMTSHSLVYAGRDSLIPISHDRDSVLRDIDACCRLNTLFLDAIARADLQTAKPLSSVTEELRAILDSTVVSLDSRLGTRADTASAHHMAMVFDSTGASWRASKGQTPVPAFRECVAALQTEVTCMNSESTLANVLTRIADRQHCSMPGHFERHAVAYVGLASISVVAMRAVQSRSSTLGGSGDVEQFLVTARTSLVAFFDQQLLEPLRGIYEQVLANSSTGDPAAHNDFTLRESRESLHRILDQYKRDHPELEGSGMTAVLSAYEHQVRRPVRNALSGSLLETLLVITAKLKSDVEEILVRTAKQMSAQRINLHILAAVPAVLGLVGVLYAVSAIIDRSRRRGVELMSSGGDVVRYLIGDCRDILGMLKQECDKESFSWQRRVELAGQLVSVVRRIEILLARRAVNLGGDGLYRLRQDLKKLESQAPNLETKLAITDRMFQVYPPFLHKGSRTHR
jgi:hypothetical protein